MPLSDNKYLVQGVLGIRVIIVMISNLLLTKVLFSNLNENEFRSFVILVSAAGILSIIVQNTTLSSYRIFTSSGSFSNKNDRIFELQKRLLLMFIFVATLLLLYFSLSNFGIFKILPLFLAPVFIQFILAPEITRTLINENLQKYFIFLTLEPMLRIAIIGAILIATNNININAVSVVYIIVSLIVFFSYTVTGDLLYLKRKFEHKKISPLFYDDFSFSNWIFLGLLASIANTHILTFWFDRSYDSTIVSFRGVSTQVFTALISVGSSSFVLLKKDIMISFSRKSSLVEREKILLSATRLQILLMLVPSIIIMYKTEYILWLWLENSDTTLSTMIKWTVISALIFNLHQPITAAFHGSRFTKIYTLFTDIFLLSTIFLYFILGSFGISAIDVYRLQALIIVVSHFVRLGVGYHKGIISLVYVFENALFITSVLLFSLIFLC